MEHKVFEFEIKKLHEDGEFEGLAAVYKNVDFGGDKFLPGVFADSISQNKGKVPILRDHLATVMGNAGFGKSADEDGIGLAIVGVLNLEKEAGREARAMMKQAKKMGINIALSVGFTIAEGGAKFVKGIREISKATLWEYSIVVFGMNPKARVSSIKSLKEIADPEEIAHKKKNLEQILRDADCSQVEAKRAVSVLFPRDAGLTEDDKAIQALTEKMNKLNEQLTI